MEKSNALYKSIGLYKNQFELYDNGLHGSYLSSRLRYDLSNLSFKIKYIYDKNKDVSNIEELHKEYIDMSSKLRSSFCNILMNILEDIMNDKGLMSKYNIDNINDIILDLLINKIDLSSQIFKFDIVLISDNKDLLNELDNIIDDNKAYNLYPNTFFRYNSESYSDAIPKLYPELFDDINDDLYNKDNSVYVHNFTFQVTENCNLNCLPAGSKILMADNSEKNIEDIKMGDKVLSVKECDNNESQIEYMKYEFNGGIINEVTHLFKNNTSRLYHIHNDYIDIKMTGNHPILIGNGNWINVEDLSIHDGIWSYTNDNIDLIYDYTIDIIDYPNPITVYNFETTEHTYISDSIFVHNCTYCYQGHKSKKSMTFEIGKEFIDKLLNDDYSFINKNNSPAIIIEFIGGEPLLEINLIRKLYEYFLDKCYELNHPYFYMHRVSLCSNGMLYFDKDVQSFFKDYANNISFNISIDGNKQLHDSCRIQPSGEGSYDIDMMALNHFNKYHTKERNSKMTLAPENIKYLYDSVVNFINQDMDTINLNCVFEDVWSIQDAIMEYYQLKKLSDYLIENNLEHIYISILDETPEERLLNNSDQSSCFIAGSQILSENGNINIEDVQVGDKLYTASGNIHEVTNMYHGIADNTVVLYATGTFPLECTSDHKVFAKKFKYMGWKHVIHYSEPDFYPVSELRKGDRIGLPVLDLSKNKDNYITKEMAYAVGIYIADGSINGSSVVITPGYDRDKFIYNMLTKAGLTINEKDSPTTIRYNIPKTLSENNRIFCELCISCGKGAINKHFPKIIFESTELIVRSALVGYTGSDGSRRDKNNDKQIGNYAVSVNTISRHLANDLLILLRSCGMSATCYINKREGTTMVIEGRTVNVHDRYEVYFTWNKINDKSFKYDEKYPVMWTGIRNIDTITGNYDVFCPTVMPIDKDILEEHTVIVNGISVQQCGGDGRMLALDYSGKFYPCIRYMPSSVGSDIPDMSIGNVNHMVGRNEQSPILEKLDKITRRSQTNDICYDCPISSSCSSCFKAGTIITTDQGGKSIEDIEIGDKVLTRSGNYNSVYNTFKKHTNTPISLRAIGTPTIYTTAEHPFLIKKHLGVDRYDINGIKVSDNRIAKYSDPEWVEAKDIKKGDRVCLNVPELGNVVVNKYIAYFVGRWLGDGWVTPFRSNINNKWYKQYSLCCGLHETDELEFMMNSSGISFSKCKKNNSTTQNYTILSGNRSSNPLNLELISILSKCGAGSIGKRIATEIFSWNRDSLMYLFHGYIHADGSLDKDNCTIRFATVSKHLAWGFSTILRMFGINPSWTEYNTEPNKKGTIMGRTVNLHRMYEVRFNHNPDKKRVSTRFDNGFAWAPVKYIKNEDEQYDVYNISVENDPTYYADGVLVHNCIALQYQTFGNADKKTTFICNNIMMEHLANVYYWNLLNIKHPEYNLPVRKIQLPDEWILKFLPKEELELLKLIELKSILSKMESK